MTETSVPITPGTGANIDGFNSGAAGAIRQGVVIADPLTTANVLLINAAGAATVTGTGSLAAAAPTTGCLDGGLDQTGKLQAITVAVFHNADNQMLSGTGYGQLTGGVAQIINCAGNLDRARETGSDGVPANGIPAGAASFAMAFKTSIAGAITLNSNPQAVTPAAMSGTIGGVAWSIQQGSTLVIDTGALAETVYVTSVSSTQFTAIFSKNHSGGVKVFGFVFNQERDAAGEADGASGIGTAVAAEYEFNGGAPGGGNFDRARSLQAKGKASQTISAGGGQGSTQFTLTGNTGLKAGMQVLAATAGFPTAGTYETVYVDFSYVEGTNTVPLLSATTLANTYTTIYYDQFSSMGPGLNGFIPVGIGIEEEALYDPLSGLYFIERAATQDGVSPQNVVLENPGLINGAGTVDRARSAPGTTGVTAVSSDGSKATYRYAVTGFAPVATPTAMAVLQGSATKTIRIKRIKISGVATANGNMQFQLTRRSTAGTLGSAVLTAITAAKHDINDAAATAVVSTVGTANYTALGTTAGQLAADRIGLCTTATGVPTPLVYDFSTRQDKALILRGVADFITIDGNGSAVPAGASIDMEIETEEDNS